MICLILLILVNCQSTNYYEAVGIKNELFTKRQGNYINATSNIGIDNRTNYYNQEIKEEINNGEVKNMEDMQSIVTALGSAIAGVYCLVKTIINAFKKMKKN